MIRRYTTVLALLALSYSARAQSGFGLEYRPAAAVVHGADTLRHAWAGGLNTPQFSNIDLNGDGQADLFVFERESSRVTTFLSVANPVGTGRRWQYAPQYESLFPAGLSGWALLRDYDCDGRPDLFTKAGAGDIRVFRNVAGAGGRPRFQVASAQLLFANTPTGPANINLTIGSDNLPALQDVNGDGKLDILSFDFVSSTTIELYLNTSPGTCGGALTFRLESNYWGQLASAGGCASYQVAGQPPFTARRPTHSSGHSVLLLDLDGDGDQDLLDGRDGCPELVRLLNQGTAQAAAFSPTGAGVSASFPSAAAPARAVTFPAGYSVDANFDGRPDLVVAPNIHDNRADRLSLRNPTQLFENAAPSGAPIFVARPGGFLQADMLDVSEGAAPAFGDVSGDGLPDMLIGSLADLVNGRYRASLTYYRNVGTRARPVFSHASDDYAGLAALGLQGIRPVLVDLNRDGALDLAYGAWNPTTSSQQLHYILNTAPAGQPAVFSPAAANTFKQEGPSGAGGAGVLPYMQHDKPCFTDVDNDGYVDLLIGTNEPREAGMSLRYFRNRARGPLDSAFVLVDNDFGRIRAGGARPLNLSPAVADFDGDGAPDLLTADASGTLRLFANYRAQPAIFVERTDLLYNSATGQYEGSQLGTGPYVHTTLAAADVNGDGAPELFAGLQTGGVLSYGTRNRTATAARGPAARSLAVQVYPNPATARATVETPVPTRLRLLDLTGRELHAGAALQRRHELSVAGLAPGVYLVRAEAADGTVAVQRLLVR